MELNLKNKTYVEDNELEEGIDWCPYCGGDLIRNVGNHYGCNECDKIWEIKEEHTKAQEG